MESPGMTMGNFFGIIVEAKGVGAREARLSPKSHPNRAKSGPVGGPENRRPRA